MTWQNDMARGYIEVVQVSKDLKRGNREINESYKTLNGWADRIMKAFNIDPYADYPKRTNKPF